MHHDEVETQIDIQEHQTCTLHVCVLQQVQEHFVHISFLDLTIQSSSRIVCQIYLQPKFRCCAASMKQMQNLTKRWKSTFELKVHSLQGGMIPHSLMVVVRRIAAYDQVKVISVQICCRLVGGLVFSRKWTHDLTAHTHTYKHQPRISVQWPTCNGQFTLSMQYNHYIQTSCISMMTNHKICLVRAAGFPRG